MKWHQCKIGNVVKWSNSLWIVVENMANGLRLVSFSMDNISASPTFDWPTDKTLRVDSVKYVADSCADYIGKSMAKIFSGGLQ